MQLPDDEVDVQTGLKYTPMRFICQVESHALQSLSHKVKKGERFMATLRKGTRINDYKVEKFLKVSGLYNVESYMMVSDSGERAIMKLIVDGCVCPEFSEEVCSAMNKSQAFLPVDSGKTTVKSIEYAYVIRKYIEGEKLSDILAREGRLNWTQASLILVDVLRTLSHLHGLEQMVVHNDITPRNVIVSGDDAYLIGMGHLSHSSFGRPRFDLRGLDPWYMAPETSRKRFNVKTDIFSAGVLFYKMLTGLEPWSSAERNITSAADLREARREPLGQIYDIYTGVPLTEVQMNVVAKMLAPDCDKRYCDAAEVMRDLLMIRAAENAAATVETPGLLVHDISKLGAVTSVKRRTTSKKKKSKEGGFSEVAGLENVKQLLSDEVLFVLKNPDKAEKYRLKAPNGMLFYGPPGCGKTYVAEKFAQESKLNFVMVKGSDLGSIYIHGTQGKIKELFDAAEKKAPTVLCFDELDGMIPDRSKVSSEASAGEVNEFLTQLNNCADRGIFVIGTTNRPNMIDPAVLRSGRMDHLVYIPMPDMEARKELFRIHLKGRPQLEDVDVEKLASQTEGYVASDIELIVNRAALIAARKDVPLSQELLEERIASVRKSVSDSDNASYESMRQQLESSAKTPERRRIGFITGK